MRPPDASRRGPDAETPKGSIDVVIIEDMREVREGLAALINGTPGFRCASSHRTMEDALAGPGIGTVSGYPDGSRAAGNVGHRGHPRPAGAVSEIPSSRSPFTTATARSFDALCAGASGYLLKNTPPERLLDALREIADGGAPMSPEVARRVVRLFREFRPPDHAPYRLTPQESELLRLLADGHHRKTAAQEMGISVNTVSFHLKNIYDKLQVHSKTEAVAKALRERLV